jgi:DNA polymerase III sliding clamp (beta) subunit (PCNA family)
MTADLVTTFRPEPEVEAPAQQHIVSKTVAVDTVTLGKMLPALVKMCDSSDSRPVLNSVAVCVDDDNLAFVVADGYRLAILRIRASDDNQVASLRELDVYLDDLPSESFLIPSAGAKEIARAFKSQGKMNPTAGGLCFSRPGGIPQIVATYGDERITRSYPAVDGPFPKWRQLVPAIDGEDAQPIVAVNPAYLVDVASAARALNPAGGLRIHFSGPTSPLLFTIDNADDHTTMEIVVMPVHVPEAKRPHEVVTSPENSKE